MKWAKDAEAAIRGVPFFVRKRVRARVEKEAAHRGSGTVSLADVKATQARFLNTMASEVRGYRIETCFGPNGCPNRAAHGESLLERLEALLKGQDLLGFLKAAVPGDLKFHHEFRIALADCPNACSQPQIKDIGIIGACTPAVTDADCSPCGACVDACAEGAVDLDTHGAAPRIDGLRCLACGKCAAACPTGTLTPGRQGYRVQLGGKLGRHPQLAREVPGIFSEDGVLRIVEDCLRFYKAGSNGGRRFAECLAAPAFEAMCRRHRP